MDDLVRASDADRDAAAAALRSHFAAGRLDAGELDERLAAALSARTLGELHAVMADLPPAGAGQLGPARDRLERGYRRLLACYPAAWRHAHDQEMLAVLMTAAPEGKPRPGLGEAADLVAGGLQVRCQRTRDGAAPAWRDALAVLTVVLPLFVLTTTAVQDVERAFRSGIAIYPGGGFGPVNSSLLAAQLTVPLGLASIALLRRYRVAALTVAAAVIGLAVLAGWTDLSAAYGLTSPYVLLAVAVQVGAVTASPGPRRALALLTWKSAALTVIAAASIAVTSYPLSIAAVVMIVAAMSLSSSLGRWLLLLLAIPLWPYLTLSLAIGGGIAIRLAAPPLLVTSPISGLVLLQPTTWWLSDAYLIPAVLLCLFAAAASRDSLRSRQLAKPTA